MAVLDLLFCKRRFITLLCSNVHLCIYTTFLLGYILWISCNPSQYFVKH